MLALHNRTDEIELIKENLDMSDHDQGEHNKLAQDLVNRIAALNKN